MAEKQQDLNRRSSETPHEPLQSEEFFSRLSLPDIYGRYLYPTRTKFQIDWDTYHALTYEGKEKSVVTQQALMERFNMPSISAWGSDGPSIHPGPTKPLAFWIPQQKERRLLTGLAASLAPGKDQPNILQVEAGTAIIGKILAAESSGKITALETDERELFSVPTTSGDITVLHGDIWGVLQQFGPKYPAQIEGEVRRHLENVQKHQVGIDLMTLDMPGVEKGVSARARYLSKVAMKALQQLSPQYAEESPVDLAIFSASQKEFNGLTTIALRDGIQPKAIVYIRHAPGYGPMPENWREKYNESHIRKNWFANFDPGENYTTVAAWRTFSEKDWGYHMYDLSLGEMQTEVLVQLRKDVRLTDLPLGDSSQYPFDREVLEVLGKYGKAEEFQRGISSAREQLLAA